MKELEYDMNLKTLKLPSLEYRRRRGDMIEVYKILNGAYDSKHTNSLLKINHSNTRGHPFKLTKESVNTNLLRNFFSNRIINHWNSLPEKAVLSSSVNSFKTSIDQHWSHLQFTCNI